MLCDDDEACGECGHMPLRARLLAWWRGLRSPSKPMRHQRFAPLGSYASRPYRPDDRHDVLCSHPLDTCPVHRKGHAVPL